LKGEIVEGTELQALQQALCKTLDVAAVTLCASGSLALEIALRGFGIKRGDHVMVPAFCCSAVIGPIRAVGAAPVLADVGAELNLTAQTIETALTASTRAIIVPHLFGNPAEIGSICELVRSRNIHVIDDAAQALGAAVNGKLLGTWGDAGVLSFGREKVCGGLGGGAVLFSKRELAAATGTVPLLAASRATTLRCLLSTLLWHRWRRWSQPFQRALPFWFDPAPDRPGPRYRSEAMPNLYAAVARSLVESLPENLAARRARVEAYRALLAGDERLELITHRSGSACLAQVVRVFPRRRHEDRAARVLGVLRDSGYEVQGSYIPIHLLPGFEKCKWRRLSYTESVWEHLIELPCGPGVGLNHVEAMAATIKQALDA
jgi:dTDP-4-amino-4,6-dideoxygalactose transaminase